MKPILEIQHVTKTFNIGGASEKYLSLRDALANPFKRLKPGKTEKFVALNDVNFTVMPGESIGVIGRNGAGKSTLLKILSKITPPTSGRIISRGRIASLLEVGTGFHPELTGKENIYMNGSILGMRKVEIDKHFDAIVEFSGVEKFLETPLKRYSSGMQLRLAFAVAAHLEPEILIIDEVLAVGDAEFQKKCLGKMDEVSKSGRTVLFVSHNMGTIAQLCNKSILLNKGQVVKEGNTLQVIDYYLQNNFDAIEAININEALPYNHFKTAYMCNADAEGKTEFSHDDTVSIRVVLQLPEYHSALELAMRLIDRNKNAVCTIHEKVEDYTKDKETVSMLITIPAHFLTPGTYSWIMCINHPGVKNDDLQSDVLGFTIFDTGSDFSRYDGANYGSVFAKYSITNI